MSKDKKRENTKLMHLGRAPEEYFGSVNPPISRASTFLYGSLDDYENPDHKYRYSRLLSPIADHFEQAMAELENGYGAINAPSGLSAIATALQSFLKSGDHLLVSDSLYPPARDFCDNVLTKFGVNVEYYDPLIGDGITDLIKDNTAVIYMESPGSATFEIIDIPVITAIAKDKNIVTICDNSWSGGWLFKPLDHGADIVCQSVTKYIGGHSDVMLGFAAAKTEEHYKILRKTKYDMGICAGSEDIYLALRGLRTMPVRMKQCAQNALEVATWLQTRDEVQRVFHPALKNDPNHALWKRDFKGCNGLVSILLQKVSREANKAFVESLELFPIGSSWGGYESLLQPQYLKKSRTAVPWEEEGAMLRLQVGLEDPEDLIEDLDQAFEKFNKARG